MGEVSSAEEVPQVRHGGACVQDVPKGQTATAAELIPLPPLPAKGKGDKKVIGSTPYGIQVCSKQPHMTVSWL